jgi:hypothetical protein
MAQQTERQCFWKKPAKEKYLKKRLCQLTTRRQHRNSERQLCPEAEEIAGMVG